MSLWRSFEKRIQQESDLCGHLCIQIPLETRVLSGGKTITVKSKPDFMAAVDSLAILFDAKSTQEDRWNLKANVFRHDKSANKIHQWNQLVTAQYKGVQAGYLIWFLNQRRIVWAGVKAIEHMVATGVASVTPDSPYVTSQPDDQIIDIGKLVFPDLKKITERIVSVP